MSEKDVSEKVKKLDIRKQVEALYLKNEEVSFKPGDTVKVHQLIQEGNKERVQIFEGVVIAIRGSGTGLMFTVRKLASGIGVERIFPFHSPKVAKVEVKQKGHVRRAKLNYLKKLSGKAARIREAKYKPVAS